MKPGQWMLRLSTPTRNDPTTDFVHETIVDDVRVIEDPELVVRLIKVAVARVKEMLASEVIRG